MTTNEATAATTTTAAEAAANEFFHSLAARGAAYAVTTKRGRLSWARLYPALMFTTYGVAGSSGEALVHLRDVASTSRGADRLTFTYANGDEVTFDRIRDYGGLTEALASVLRGEVWDETEVRRARGEHHYIAEVTAGGGYTSWSLHTNMPYREVAAGDFVTEPLIDPTGADFDFATTTARVAAAAEVAGLVSDERRTYYGERSLAWTCTAPASNHFVAEATTGYLPDEVWLDHEGDITFDAPHSISGDVGLLEESEYLRDVNDLLFRAPEALRAILDGRSVVFGWRIVADESLMYSETRGAYYHADEVHRGAEDDWTLAEVADAYEMQDHELLAFMGLAGSHSMDEPLSSVMTANEFEEAILATIPDWDIMDDTFAGWTYVWSVID